MTLVNIYAINTSLKTHGIAQARAEVKTEQLSNSKGVTFEDQKYLETKINDLKITQVNNVRKMTTDSSVIDQNLESTLAAMDIKFKNFAEYKDTYLVQLNQMQEQYSKLIRGTIFPKNIFSHGSPKNIITQEDLSKLHAISQEITSIVIENPYNFFTDDMGVSGNASELPSSSE